MIYSDLDSKLLLDFGDLFPKAFAFWYADSDVVFVSKKLQEIFNIKTNKLSILDFTKNCKKFSGDFLYTASEKLSDHPYRKEFSTLTKSDCGEQFFAKLQANQDSGFYIFSLEPAEESPETASSRTNSNSEIKNILNALPIYIWQKDLDSRITFCNKAYSDALESTTENVVQNNLKLIKSSKNKDNEYSIKSKQFVDDVVIKGDRKYLEVTENACIGNSPSLCFALDITEKEELKREYGDYKKQTEETLDQISVPILIFDSNMELIFANSAIEKLVGFDIWSLPQRSYEDIVSAVLDKGLILTGIDDREFKEKATNLFKELIDPRHKTLYMQNGKILDVFISPNRSGGIIILFEDISDTVNLQRTVDSISSIQQETLDHLNEGIIVFGTDNCIKLLNSAIWDVFSAKKFSNFRKMHLKEFFYKISDTFDSSINLEIWVSKIISMASQKLQHSDTLKLSSGKTVKYSYVPFSEGLHFLSFVDNTEKQLLENAMNEKNKIVDQVDKIKTDLISNISNELRAPLNTILGFSDILINQYFGELNTKQLEYCHGIMKSVSKISDVVNAIINLTSIEVAQSRIQYQEVNLFNFLEDTTNLFKTRASAQQVAIQNKFKNTEQVAFFDEKSMKQAIFHILSRLLKFTPQNETISLDAKFSQNAADPIEISISDTNLELALETLKRLSKMLDSNMPTNSSEDYVDFGLILANNIVHLHDGHITLESENETKITIFLPKKK